MKKCPLCSCELPTGICHNSHCSFNNIYLEEDQAKQLKDYVSNRIALLDQTIDKLEDKSKSKILLMRERDVYQNVLNRIVT